MVTRALPAPCPVVLVETMWQAIMKHSDFCQPGSYHGGLVCSRNSQSLSVVPRRYPILAQVSMEANGEPGLLPSHCKKEVAPPPSSPAEQSQNKPVKTEGLNKIQSCIIPKTSRFQPRITHHINNQEYLKWNEKRQSIDANTEITRILELSEKDF